ncbi:cytochrome b5 domain-containing protein [Candidatus Parcubacteria bacterium]|nr:cytochrome b5 domain-containing protein [Candidatus Parcubacteria bacterium]
MQSKSLAIIVALVLFLGVGGLVYYKKNSSSVGPGPTSAPASASITLAQVAAHNSRTSCWAVIGGFVYDLTSWIPHHPGGEQAILQLCGTDGTAKFNGQHGSDATAKATLSGFKIGTLTQ